MYLQLCWFVHETYNNTDIEGLKSTYPRAVKSAKEIFLNESFWTDCAVNNGALFRGLKPEGEKK